MRVDFPRLYTNGDYSWKQFVAVVCQYDNFSGSGEGGGGSLHQYQFYFNDSVPEDAVMTVHIVKNAQAMSVPFEFKDLTVPAKRKQFVLRGWFPGFSTNILTG